MSTASRFGLMSQESPLLLFGFSFAGTVHLWMTAIEFSNGSSTVGAAEKHMVVLLLLDSPVKKELLEGDHDLAALKRVPAREYFRCGSPPLPSPILSKKNLAVGFGALLGTVAFAGIFLLMRTNRRRRSKTNHRGKTTTTTSGKDLELTRAQSTVSTAFRLQRSGQKEEADQSGKEPSLRQGAAIKSSATESSATTESLKDLLSAKMQSLPRSANLGKKWQLKEDAHRTRLKR